MGKGKETRNRIINAMLPTVYINGYKGTSMNDVVLETGIQKGTLYFHFKSKDQLAVEILCEAYRQYNEFLKTRMKGDSYVSRIESMLDAVVLFHKRREFRGGCIFGNFALETGGSGTEVELCVKEIFRKWTASLSGLIYKGMENGELDTSCDPDVLAGMIISAIEGGIMLSKLEGEGRALDNAVEIIKTRILK